MARMANRHINLRRLMDRVWSAGPKPQAELYGEALKDPADILELLKKERLQMTDWDFRQRYSRWL